MTYLPNFVLSIVFNQLREQLELTKKKMISQVLISANPNQTDLIMIETRPVFNTEQVKGTLDWVRSVINPLLKRNRVSSVFWMFKPLYFTKERIDSRSAIKPYIYAFREKLS